MAMSAADTVQKIASDLHSLGVSPGETLLVHSSLRSLGPVDGGAETVVQGLFQALGEEGTLLFPALSFATVGAANPVFDVRRTPSCVGALPEYFRQRKGTCRSVHPTHSVSGCGKRSAELLKDHFLDETSCGEHSPFRRLREEGDWILFIGCSIAPNTSMHAVEELVTPPYLHREKVLYKCILEDGSERTMDVKRHNFQGYAQNYRRLGEILTPVELHHGSVLEAECYLMKISAMWEKGYEALKKDPFYFVRKLD